MRPYQELAAVYDRLMENYDYSGHTGFFLQLAHQHGWKGRSVLDLACGTGNITLELLKRGYFLQGLDKSTDMLAVADEKIHRAGYSVFLTCQDMRDFILPEEPEMVICALDSLNYLLKEEDLARTFHAVHKVLKPGGLFLFDVHSEYKLKVLLGNRTLFYTGDDTCYIWQNRLAGDICEMKLDIFIKREAGLYERIEELHRERYYSIEILRRLLTEEGFHVLGFYGDRKISPPERTTKRIFCAAKRI